MKYSFLILLTLCPFLAICQLNQIPWANDFGTTGGHDRAVKVKVDEQGYIYTLGSFLSQIHAEVGTLSGTVSHVSGGAGAMFISKMGSDGSLIWTKPFFMPVSSIYSHSIVPSDMEVNELGEVFVSGTFGGDFVIDYGFSNSMYTAEYGHDFLMKISTDGEFEWVKSWETKIKTIDLLSNGRLVVTGVFSGTIDLDPDTGVANVTSVYPKAFSIIMNSNQGTYISSSTFGEVSPTGSSLHGISETITNELDEMFITGTFSGSLHFNTIQGGVDIVSNGDTDCFVLKLNSSGQVEWAKNFGGSGSDHGNSIYTLGQSKIVITGGLVGNVSFEPGNSQGNVSAVGIDGFTLVLESNGAFVWGNAFGGDYTQSGMAVCTDSQKNTYIVGLYLYQMDADPSSQVVQHVALEYEDGFIVKFDSLGNYLESASINGYSYNWLNAICVDHNDNIYSAGRHVEGIVFGGLNQPNDLPDVDGITPFILRFGGFAENQSLNSDEVSISPNPASDFITIYHDRMQSLELIDGFGRTCISKVDLSSDHIVLNVNDLPSGYYTVIVSTEKGSLHKKVLIL